MVDAQPVNDGAGGTADHAAPDVAATGTGGSSPEAEAGPGGGGGMDVIDSGAAGDAPPDRSQTDGGGGTVVPDASDRGVPDVSPDIVPDRGPDAPPDVSADVTPDVVIDQVVVNDHVDAAPPPPGGYITVVAHPDDDVLFFNPDLEGIIRQGSPSTTVYVTSGDASEEARGGWPAREAGIKDAQAGMANTTTGCLQVEQGGGGTCAWACAAATFAGKNVQRCTLPTTSVTTIFLRLPDLRIDDGGADVMTSLEYLWGPPIRGTTVASLTRIDDSTVTYTRADLINVLAAIMADRGVMHVLTMDGTFAYGPRDYEHHDHVSVALFALAAAQQFGQVGDVHTYRGYTTQFSAENVSAPDLTEKNRLMSLYGANGCEGDYDAWCRREISYGSTTGTGRLMQGGQCIESDGASSVSVQACSGGTNQQWAVNADASIVGINNLCLATDGSSIGVAACDHSAGQRWTLFVNGQLRGLNGICVSSDGVDVSAMDCTGDIHIDEQPNGSLGPDAGQIWSR